MAKETPNQRRAREKLEAHAKFARENPYAGHQHGALQMLKQRKKVHNHSK